jgi:hypothetical protein
MLVPTAASDDLPVVVPGIAPRRVKTGGRRAGTPNRITADVRAALRDLAEGNAGRVQDWLDRVADESPAEAIRLYLGLCRYVVPVLSAAAIADITPKSPREALSKMTTDELWAVIVESAAAADLVKQGVKTKRELFRRLAGAPAPALPKPDPTDEELLK